MNIPVQLHGEYTQKSDFVQPMSLIRGTKFIHRNLIYNFREE